MPRQSQATPNKCTSWFQSKIIPVSFRFHLFHFFSSNNIFVLLLCHKYMEILLHTELQNDDFVESRINCLTKKHGAFLKSKTEFRILPFLKLVKQVFRNPEVANSPEFELKVDDGLSFQALEQEDLFLMCFYAWLKSKIVNRPIYQTTSDLLAT